MIAKNWDFARRQWNFAVIGFVSNFQYGEQMFNDSTTERSF